MNPALPEFHDKCQNVYNGFTYDPTIYAHQIMIAVSPYHFSQASRFLREDLAPIFVLFPIDPAALSLCMVRTPCSCRIPLTLPLPLQYHYLLFTNIVSVL